MTDHLDKARGQVAEGRYKAAVESLYGAFPAALGGDSGDAGLDVASRPPSACLYAMTHSRL